MELAQLRTKLPREALNAIVGVTSPAVAWARLDELIGNREVSIVTALRRLREFKTVKQAPHEQMLEIATAVQRCHTVLNSLDAEQDLLRDRETVTAIVQALPSLIQALWYQRDIPPDETVIERGQSLLAWLER